MELHRWDASQMWDGKLLYCLFYWAGIDVEAFAGEHKNGIASLLHVAAQELLTARWTEMAWKIMRVGMPLPDPWKIQVSQRRGGKGEALGWKRVTFFPCRVPFFYLALDLPSVIGAKFGTSTNMLLVWARRLPRGVESGPLVFGGIQCESVHFVNCC